MISARIAYAEQQNLVSPPNKNIEEIYKRLKVAPREEEEESEDEEASIERAKLLY